MLAYSGAMRRLAVELVEDRQRSAPPQHGAARRPRRDRAAGGAAGIVDHAGQGESVDAGDGQPGLLPGDRLRHDRLRRGGGRAARAERDDAGHRLERAARLHDPARGDEGAAHRDASTASRPTPRAAASCSTGAPRVATALSPYIGYAQTAEIAKESVRTGTPIRDLVLERGLHGRRRQLDRILSAEAMTQPGHRGKEMNVRRKAPAVTVGVACNRCMLSLSRGFSAQQPSRRPERPPLPAEDLGLLEGPGPRRLAEARSDHGRPGHRRRLGRRRHRRRRRLVHDSPGATAWDRTARSMRRTCSARCSTRSAAAWHARNCRTCGSSRGRRLTDAAHQDARRGARG